MRSLFAFLVMCILICSTAMYAQTSLNPDISLIGDFRAYSHDDPDRIDDIEELNLADPSLELNIGGALNPYARADAVFGWHGGHNAEIEEAFVTVHRGLPLNTNLRVGKYLLEFGRLNPVHEHAWSFIHRPLPHVVFFGEEGLSDMAVRTSFLLPTGNAYTELMAGILKGDALMGHLHDEEEHEHAEKQDDHDHAEDGDPDPGFFGRLATSFALGMHTEMALGVSAVNSVYEFAHEEEEVVKAVLEEHVPDQLRAWIFGIDAKYKFKPDRYTTLQIEGEFLARYQDQHEEGEDNLTSYGGYGYIDYRFAQKYNIGGIFEYLETEMVHEHDGEHEIESSSLWRAGLFVGFAPIEETSLVRLAGHWTELKEGESFWEITLQLVVSLGPHKPHNF